MALQNLLKALTASATTAVAGTASGITALLPLQTVIMILQSQINILMNALNGVVGTATTAVAAEQTAVSSALASAVNVL